MKVAIVGTGYVGLVTGTCFSEVGIDVVCVDSDSNKIGSLNDGIIPIYEPGLEEMVHKNREAGRLHFTTRIEEGIENADAVLIAVGTPPDEDGSADLTHVLNVAHQIGRMIDHYILIVNKSTVPVGTAAKVEQVIKDELKARGSSVEFDVVSNPEFLKEGTAINDFMMPDRVIVGTSSGKAKEIMDRLYRPFMMSSYRVIHMDVISAEMTKYAANAMLATRISFMNDLANLCEATGADINMVRKGIGSDHRIGNKFLYPGIGYGGSCFPKDVKALIQTAKAFDKRLLVLEAVENVNELQKRILFNKLYKHYNGNLKGLKIAVWGLAFKPETDDIREAPSLVLIELLRKEGAEVTAYDPVAMDECRKKNIEISYAKDMYEACIDADAVILATEWKEFRIPSWPTLRKIMKNPVIFDGRNIYNRQEVMENGFKYYCI